MKRIFITGIDTGVGKTFVSAALANKLNANYWKPIQCGDLEQSDSKFVNDFLENQGKVNRVLKEGFTLKTPCSPHAAAKYENCSIEIENLKIPQCDKDLIIEGAGGILVPFNDKYNFSHFILKHELELILVIRPYLGSINHSLLNFYFLENKNIKVKGIIFSGGEDKEAIKYIKEKSSFPILGYLDEINSEGGKVSWDQLARASEKLEV